jgi:hypothetical protein
MLIFSITSFANVPLNLYVLNQPAFLFRSFKIEPKTTCISHISKQNKKSVIISFEYHLPPSILNLPLCLQFYFHQKNSNPRQKLDFQVIKIAHEIFTSFQLNAKSLNKNRHFSTIYFTHLID